MRLWQQWPKTKCEARGAPWNNYMYIKPLKMKTQNVHCTLCHNTIANVLQCVTPLMPLCVLWYIDVWYGKNIRIICTASESIFDESKIFKIEINCIISEKKIISLKCSESYNSITPKNELSEIFPNLLINNFC